MERLSPVSTLSVSGVSCAGTGYVLPSVLEIPSSARPSPNRNRGNWRGGETLRSGRNGKGRYVYIHLPDHPRACKQGYVPRYILTAEAALGGPLPAGAEVHHYGDSLDDGRVVVCPDRKYHKLLHARMRVIAAGGNPNTDKICADCKTPRAFAEFPRNRAQKFDGLHRVCRECGSKRSKQAWARRKAERVAT